MRVLALVAEAFGGHGGIALYNRDLLKALCSLPYCTEVVALPRRQPSQPGRLPERLRYIGRGDGGKVAFLKDAAALVLRDAGFDLVICGHINLLPIARLAAFRAKAPILLVIYGIDAWAPSRSPLVNLLAKRVQGFISISEHTRQRFVAWSRVSPDKGFLLPNAIHLEAYGMQGNTPELVQRYGLEGKKVLMTLGRLAASERYKGVDRLLEIFPDLAQRVPELRYLVVGDGDDLPRLREKARVLGLSQQVVFAGRIPEPEKADHYRVADAYAMPGRGEGFGFVYLEAMACGVPVVASRLDGSREAVRDGALGILVDPEDRDELIDGVVAALSRPKAVPAGLEHFSYPRFRGRLDAIVARFAPSLP